ncbi:MAG: putative pre-16S rRNA nuclease [Phycisphaerae bacterium]
MTGRFLGVDLGTKRIGLALAASDTGVVSPLRVLEAHSDVQANARSILAVADEYDVTGIVVGLPLNMDGTEGPQAKLSRKLADQLQQMTATANPTGERALDIHLHDERLTSHAADGRLIERDLTRKKKKARQDAVAAQVLLESFLKSGHRA